MFLRYKSGKVSILALLNNLHETLTSFLVRTIAWIARAPDGRLVCSVGVEGREGILFPAYSVLFLGEVGHVVGLAALKHASVCEYADSTHKSGDINVEVGLSAASDAIEEIAEHIEITAVVSRLFGKCSQK